MYVFIYYGLLSITRGSFIQLWVVLVGKDMMFIALRRLFHEKGNIIKGGRGPLCSIPIFWTSLKSC